MSIIFRKLNLIFLNHYLCHWHLVLMVIIEIILLRYIQTVFYHMHIVLSKWKVHLILNYLIIFLHIQVLQLQTPILSPIVQIRHIIRLVDIAPIEIKRKVLHPNTDILLLTVLYLHEWWIVVVIFNLLHFVKVVWYLDVFLIRNWHHVIVVWNERIFLNELTAVETDQPTAV